MAEFLADRVSPFAFPPLIVSSADRGRLGPGARSMPASTWARTNSLNAWPASLFW